MTERRMILCCTQNDAMWIQRKLAHIGISGRMQKLPRSKTVRSCSWGVEISGQDEIRAEHCLQQSGVHWQWMKEESV